MVHATKRIVLSFGEHKGKLLMQVDDAYLRWMQANVESSWWRRAAAEALEERGEVSTQSRKLGGQSVQGLIADLKSCSSTKCLERGKEIHGKAVETGSASNIYVASKLVSMYAKCGSMMDARRVFDSIQRPDVVLWNALILGYAENGQGLTALDLFEKMRSQGYVPDALTLVAALKACISSGFKQVGSECRERVEQIHSLVSRNGWSSDAYVQNTLIDVYAKSGCIVEARRVFDSLKHPDVVAWNSLILGYAENGDGVTALNLFVEMRSRGCAPSSITFIAALKACSHLAADQEGSSMTEHRDFARHIHLLAIEHGCESDDYVQNTLIDVYAKCGDMVNALQVFNTLKHRGVVSWTALILGYAANGEATTALNLFTAMKCQACAPNPITVVAALKACGLVGALEYGKNIHSEFCLDSELDAMLVTALVDFYAKCGSLVAAQQVFDLHSRTRDLTTWTALLAGYSRSTDVTAVFTLFEQMQDAGFRPNAVTFTCILACCSHAGLVEKGKECFESMPSKYGVFPSLEHYTGMVDILGRSNKLDDAMVLLQSMPYSPDVVTWMAVLSACHKWKNVELARLAFECLLTLDKTNTLSSAYVLMAQIYASRGMQEEQEAVFAMKWKLRSCRDSGQCWWSSELGQVHMFFDTSGC